MTSKYQNLPEIAIIGGGIAGLSLGFHLKQRGFENFKIYDSPAKLANYQNSGNYAIAGFIDPVTRVDVAHGRAFLKEYWNFTEKSFASVKAFCDKFGVKFQQGRKLRFVLTDHEEVEMKKSDKILADVLRIDTAYQQKILTTAEVKTIHDEGSLAAAVDVEGFVNSLRNQLKDKIQSKFISVQSLEKLNAEIIVFACHLGARQLLPELAMILVPVTNQWIEAKITFASSRHGIHVGDFYALTYGNQWMNCTEIDEAQQIVTMRICGARYLRKLDGTDDAEIQVQERVTQALLQALKKVFLAEKIELTREEALQECVPCDELPVVGPLLRNSKWLIATGFNHQGVTFGFQSGASLANLILDGKDPILPRRFWPERHRSYL